MKARVLEGDGLDAKSHLVRNEMGSADSHLSSVNSADLAELKSQGEPAWLLLNRENVPTRRAVASSRTIKNTAASAAQTRKTRSKSRAIAAIPAARCKRLLQPRPKPMNLLLIILILLLLFGGGGGYYYGGPMVGGGIGGLVLIILVIYLLVGRRRI